MNFYELKPTNEKVFDTFYNNAYRNVSVAKFVELLSSINTSCSVALDGNWGSGKTFFVKQVKMVMDALNGTLPPEISNKESDIKGLYGRITKNHNFQKPTNKQLCIYFDAWKNDAAEEPVLALIYEIIKQYPLTLPENTTVKKNAFDSLKELVKNISIQFSFAGFSIGSGNFLKFFEENKNDFLKDIESQENVRKSVDKVLEQLRAVNGPEKNDRLVIFVDELDRCRPTFALQLLERIKHYFDQEYITFVFSTNMKELCKTVKTYYGAEFDAERYLDKFFDLRQELPQIDIENYIKQLPYNKEEFGDLSVIFRRVAEICGLEMREITRAIKIYEITAAKFFGYFNMNNSHDAFHCVRYILPLLIGLKMTDKQKYENFINGKTPQLFEEFMNDDACVRFFNNQTYSKEECDEFYNAVLANDDYQRVFKDCLSLLSKLSEYGISKSDETRLPEIK